MDTSNFKEVFTSDEVKQLRQRVAELEADIKSEQQWASFYSQESLGRKARVEQLEAVLRECRDALVPYMQYVDGTKVLNHPAQCVAKIDEVLK